MEILECKGRLSWVLGTVDNGSERKDVYQERMLWGDKEDDAGG